MITITIRQALPMRFPRYEKIPGLGKLDKMSVSEQYVSRAKVCHSRRISVRHEKD